MPNYKGHLVGGTIAFAGLFYFLRNYNPTYFTMCEWYIFTLVGSLFPDIDIKSKGQKYFYRVVFLLVIFLLFQLRFQGVAMVSIIALLPLLVRHRGITHSLWFIMGLSFFIVFYTSTFAPKYAHIAFFDTIFFFAGCVSHLWLDLGIRRMLKG